MKQRILIVDDDIITLKILKKYLDESFEVETENAGYRFVEKIDSYDVDLILLDLEMPVVNGLQVFDEINRNNRLKNVPVAFLSGVSNPNLVRELIQKGAAGYIVKTTPKAELIQRVEKILAEKKPRVASPSVLVLEGDKGNLRIMSDTLAGDIYTVKAVRTMLDAVEYYRVHQINLFIIGSDYYGASAEEIYERLSEELRSKNIQALVLDEVLFSNELLERVRSVLE